MIINEIKFGKIVVDGIKYHQILISGEKVKERDSAKLDKTFGTSHKMGDWEKENLLENNPKLIVIGDGFYGAFETPEDFIQTCKNKNIELIVLHTPAAVKKFQELKDKNKKINALFHTTC